MQNHFTYKKSTATLNKLLQNWHADDRYLADSC
jgi:hypothetical protein